MRTIIALRKPLKDLVEGLVFLGYAIDNDPKTQQMLVFTLSALSAVDAYQEYKTHEAKPAPTNQEQMKFAMPTVECVVTTLLYVAQFAKKSGKLYGEELTQIMLRTFGICLAGRSIFDYQFHKNYSRIPAGIAGFVVGLMPGYSGLKRAAMGIAGVHSFLQGCERARSGR